MTVCLSAKPGLVFTTSILDYIQMLFLSSNNSLKDVDGTTKQRPTAVAWPQPSFTNHQTPLRNGVAPHQLYKAETYSSGLASAILH